MKYFSQVALLPLIAVVSYCGGGSSDSHSIAVTRGNDGQVVIGCSQHSEVFDSLAGRRVGSITYFSSPSVPLCKFDVTMIINKVPDLHLNCLITAEVSYTSQSFSQTDNAVCDESDGRIYNAFFREAIALRKQITLPAELKFMPIGPRPLQDANGVFILYPVSDANIIELDEDFNIRINGQILTSP